VTINVTQLLSYYLLLRFFVMEIQILKKYWRYDRRSRIVGILYRAWIFKLLWSPGIDSASLWSLAGRYDYPIPTRLLVPIDCSKIPARKRFLYVNKTTLAKQILIELLLRLLEIVRHFLSCFYSQYTNSSKPFSWHKECLRNFNPPVIEKIFLVKSLLSCLWQAPDVWCSLCYKSMYCRWEKLANLREESFEEGLAKYFKNL
jgi:hypothetical protein